MKTCNKCKENKSLTEFYSDNSKKDGKCSHCKSCINQHRMNNKDTIAIYQKEYQMTNKDTLAERKKEYNKRNMATISERRKKYYNDNKDDKLLYQRNYYQAQKVATV